MTGRVFRHAPGRAWALALYLAAGACRPAPPTELPEEDGLLESLMEEYVAERFRFYPVESTLAGLPGGDDRLGSFSRTEMENRIAWLADFHRKLIAVRLASLSQPAYLDALWLTSLVKAEILDLEERRPWERTARFYADTIRIGLTSLLLDPELEARVDDLTGRLDEIPTLVDQARENLLRGPGPWRSDGLASLTLCRELLTDFPQLLDSRMPAYRIAELAERSRVAMRSLQSLVAWYGRDDEDAPKHVWEPLGEETFARYLLYTEMVDASIPEILLEASDVLEARSGELLALGLAEFGGQPIEALLQAGELSPDVRRSVIELEEGARETARNLGHPFPLPRPIPVVAVAKYFVAPDVVRLFRPAALEPAKGPYLLVDATTPPVPRSALELLTLGEVAARYRQFVYQSETSSLLRRVFSTRTATEGWRSWRVTRLLERGDGRPEARLRLRDLHRSMVEHARLVAVVRLHAEGASLAEVERMFRERAFLSPEAARAETERAAVDPGAGSAALGRLLLRRLERDYARARPLDTETELLHRILVEGPLPLRLVRFKLLGIEDGT